MYKNDEIGLDYDEIKQGIRALKIFRTLGMKGKYRKSSSGRGYHFRIKTNHKCSKEINLQIRYMLGDCYGRYMGDVRRLQHGLKEFDILFDHKKGKKSGKWRRI
jgi:hypothetical protein